MYRRSVAYVFCGLVVLLTGVARAGEETYVVEAGEHRVTVKATVHVGSPSTVRAECIIPAPHRRVWDIVADYNHIEEFIPAVTRSEVVGERDGKIILEQEGRAGIWFIKKGFELTLEVTQIPMVFVGFKAIDGDFESFNGTWQVDPRDGGTWIAHRVDIEPNFYAPAWASRRVAKAMMHETIEAVIRACLAPEETP